MKKLISIILCTVMLLSLAPASVAADTKVAHSDIFDAVTDALDEEKIEYTAEDRDEDEEEVIEITVDGDEMELDNFEELYLVLVISEEYNSISVYCFNIINYDEDISDEDYNSLLSVINTLNHDYKYVKFYASEDYCSVDAEFESYVRPSCAGDIAIEMITDVSYIVDMASEDLGVFESR